MAYREELLTDPEIVPLSGQLGDLAHVPVEEHAVSPPEPSRLTSADYEAELVALFDQVLP